MVILASEDIGNANPTALVMANATFDAVTKIGYPESRIILSQCAVYLAASAKSNASYMAIDAALAAVRQHGDLPVPLHIRNAPTKLMKNMGYGKITSIRIVMITIFRPRNTCPLILPAASFMILAEMRGKRSYAAI